MQNAIPRKWTTIGHLDPFLFAAASRPNKTTRARRRSWCNNSAPQDRARNAGLSPTAQIFAAGEVMNKFQEIKFAQVGAPAGLGGSTHRQSPSHLRITASRFDASPLARLSPRASGRGTDVHHHAFGWYSPLAFDKGNDNVAFENRSLGSSPTPSRRNSLLSSAASSRRSVWTPSASLSTTPLSPSHLPPLSPAGDVRGRNVASARIKSYHQNHSPLRERPRMPEWFILDNMRRATTPA